MVHLLCLLRLVQSSIEYSPADSHFGRPAELVGVNGKPVAQFGWCEIFVIANIFEVLAME